MRPPRPVRTTGVLPDLRVVAPSELGGAVAAAAWRELEAVAPGRVAVLLPPSHYDEISTSLRAAGLPAVDPRVAAGEGLGATLVVLPADDANGLEFDAVVVVEPASIAGRGGNGDGPTQRGLRTLYVAMTRPTRRLTVLGTMPLPSAEIETEGSQMWQVRAGIN
jgi:hypothetical protein